MFPIVSLVLEPPPMVEARVPCEMIQSASWLSGQPGNQVNEGSHMWGPACGHQISSVFSFSLALYRSFQIHNQIDFKWCLECGVTAGGDIVRHTLQQHNEHFFNVWPESKLCRRTVEVCNASFLCLCHSVKLHVQRHTRTHTHTHTQIYFYIHIHI